MNTPRSIKRLGTSLLIGGQAVAATLRGRIDRGELFEQLLEAGPGSVLIVLIISVAAGSVFNIQVAAELTRQGAGSTVGGILAIGLAREIAPLLTACLLAGKVATAYAAQLGTMKVTEQIDALSTLSTNPYKYLVAPRLLAGFIMLPCCVLVADIIGVFGGYLISVHKLGFNPSVYIKNTWQFLEFIDVLSGLVKAAVFGFLIALMGCYHGYYSKGGAQGVGSATTNAVVSASILILGFNYLITEAFFAR